MGLLVFIVQLCFAVLCSIIPFLINPLLGIAWALWLIGVVVYTVRKNFKK